MATKPQVEPAKKTEAVKPAPVAAPVKTEAAKPAAPAPAPKPAAAPAPAVVAKAEAKPVQPVKVKPAPKARIVKKKPVAKAAAPVVKPASALVALAKKDTRIMQDTITKTVETAKKATADNTARAQAAFGDFNARTQDAVAKSTKAVEELNDFAKGNVEALVASSKIAAKGAEEIAKYSAEYGRKVIADSTENAKKFAAVKSPTEFFQLQSDLMKSSIDAMVSESSKFTENYLKLVGEITQPISNRVAVAVEKVKVAA